MKIEIKILLWNVETHLALYFFTYVARTWLLNVPKARKIALRNVAFYCWLNVRLRLFLCPKSGFVITLDYGISVPAGINMPDGTFGKINKRTS